MKKRAFTFALSLLLVFVLFACDTAAPTDESSENASSCAESVCSTVEEPVYKVVFSRGETFSEEAAANRDDLPWDADANGAYNIARKGLLVLRNIDKSDSLNNWTTKISNREWLEFAQSFNQ